MSYQYIGKLTATHGLDGKLVLRHNLENKAIWSRLPHIFIELQRESYIPYFLEERKAVSNEEVLLKLDEVETVEQARALSGKSVYLEAEVFASLRPKAVSAGMAGFMIHDSKLGALGRIEDIFETPGQVLATIQYREKEVLVPLVDATIVKVDGSARTIYVTLPEGLLDIYL